MLTVAYLANQFPCPVEPYVGEEIEELRRRGVRVIAGSVRRASRHEAEHEPKDDHAPETQLPDIRLFPLRIGVVVRAFFLCIRRAGRILPLVARILFRGHEGPLARIKALVHTGLGACYAVLLRKRGVRHIHVHHGYFGSWIAMTAARLLKLSFSITLHGSDLLLHAAYLDTKLQNCAFCFTVSEFNRRYILEHYPAVEPGKVLVSRLGVEINEREFSSPPRKPLRGPIFLLAVGRLHAVKDHAFLVRACAQLRAHGVAFECSIAGEGPERRRLESLIRRYALQDQLTLLGHVPREQMNSLYARADVVVLSSRSEGIPLVLMEAMARGKIVLAPSITGIPELVIPGQTGFLYEAGSLGDFIARLLSIHSLLRSPDSALRSSGPQGLSVHPRRQLDWVRYGAQVQVAHNFNRRQSVQSFADALLHRTMLHRISLQHVSSRSESLPHENPLLQQVQLPIQRNRSVPVRTDGSDAVAGTRDRVVLHG